VVGVADAQQPPLVGYPPERELDWSGLRQAGADVAALVDRKWELGLQSGYWDPLRPEPEPEPPSPPPVPKQQLSFAWWKTYGKPKVGKDGKVKTRWAKVAPVRGHSGYARALAYYLEQIASARGGQLLKSLADLSLLEALGTIRLLRQKLHRKRGGHEVKTVSSPADCGVKWYGNEAGARPCGPALRLW